MREKSGPSIGDGLFVLGVELVHDVWRSLLGACDTKSYLDDMTHRCLI